MNESEPKMEPLTPSQIEDLKKRWRRSVKEAEAEKPAIVERDKQLWEALDEQTLSGELRRFIFESSFNTRQIAERANVPLAALNGFLHGDASLDSEGFSRVAHLLDCHLVSSP